MRDANDDEEEQYPECCVGTEPDAPDLLGGEETFTCIMVDFLKDIWAKCRIAFCVICALLFGAFGLPRLMHWLLS